MDISTDLLRLVFLKYRSVHGKLPKIKYTKCDDAFKTILVEYNNIIKKYGLSKALLLADGRKNRTRLHSVIGRLVCVSYFSLILYIYVFVYCSVVYLDRKNRCMSYSTALMDILFHMPSVILGACVYFNHYFIHKNRYISRKIFQPFLQLFPTFPATWRYRVEGAILVWQRIQPSTHFRTFQPSPAASI